MTGPFRNRPPANRLRHARLRAIAHSGYFAESYAAVRCGALGCRSGISERTGYPRQRVVREAKRAEHNVRSERFREAQAQPSAHRSES